MPSWTRHSTAGLKTARQTLLVSTLERIAKALGVSLADLFAATEEIKEINSYDKSVMEKVALMESLNPEEKLFIPMLDASFIGKRKLKDAFSNVLTEVK